MEIDTKNWKRGFFEMPQLKGFTRYKKILRGYSFGCKNLLNFTCLTIEFHNSHHASVYAIPFKTVHKLARKYTNRIKMELVVSFECLSRFCPIKLCINFPSLLQLFFFGYESTTPTIQEYFWISSYKLSSLNQETVFIKFLK